MTQTNTTRIDDLAIVVPIPTIARQQAQVFAEAQPTLEKQHQVYCNTLAVWVVNDYLQWQQYETDLTAGDSWQPGTQLCGNEADLVVIGLGSIECRPVIEDAMVMRLPPESWHHRIAYVGVQLDPAYRQGKILGFMPILDPDDPPDEVALTELQSVDEWMDYLHRLEIGQRIVDEASVAERVREMWADQESRELLVAQLERIVHGERRSKWRVKGEKVISGRGFISAAVREDIAVRETEISRDRLQLQEVAEALLEALAKAWNKTT